ncbi:MbeD family mobilization/exclusion protein [Salmonella enterica]|nr:MbeD family mobilization/exclusion protein [Salmonella enterica]
MTELEQQLLNALEELQTQQDARLNEFEQAYKNLTSMFSSVSTENASLRQQVTVLNKQVSSLSVQVSNLSGQLQQWAMLYGKRNG